MKPKELFHKHIYKEINKYYVPMTAETLQYGRYGVHVEAVCTKCGKYKDFPQHEFNIRIKQQAIWEGYGE